MPDQRPALYSELIPMRPTATLPGVQGSTSALQTEFNGLPLQCFIKDSTTGALYFRGGVDSYAAGSRLVPIIGGSGEGFFVVTDIKNTDVSTALKIGHAVRNTAGIGIGVGQEFEVQNASGVLTSVGRASVRLTSVTAGSEVAAYDLDLFGADVNGVYGLHRAFTIAASPMGDIFVTLGLGNGTPDASAASFAGASATGAGSGGSLVFGGGGSVDGVAGGAFLAPGVASGTGTSGSTGLRDTSGAIVFGSSPGTAGNYGLIADFGDSTAAPGNAVLNHPAGKSAIALGAGGCNITNNLVAATSAVIVTLNTLDATATSIVAVPGPGGFTVTANANATADTTFSWWVLNPA